MRCENCKITLCRINRQLTDYIVLNTRETGNIVLKLVTSFIL